MKRKLFKRSLTILFFGVITLMFLNPGYSKFTEYTPDVKTKSHYSLRKKVSNYIVFSVYEISTFDFDSDDEVFKLTSRQQYYGFGQNFYKK